MEELRKAHSYPSKRHIHPRIRHRRVRIGYPVYAKLACGEISIVAFIHHLPCEAIDYLFTHLFPERVATERVVDCNRTEQSPVDVWLSVMIAFRQRARMSAAQSSPNGTLCEGRKPTLTVSIAPLLCVTLACGLAAQFGPGPPRPQSNTTATRTAPSTFLSASENASCARAAGNRCVRIGPSRIAPCRTSSTASG